MLLQNSGANQRHGIAGPSTLMVILMTLLLLAGERMASLETSYYDFLQRQKPVTASERILLVNTGATVTTTGGTNEGIGVALIDADGDQVGFAAPTVLAVTPTLDTSAYATGDSMDTTVLSFANAVDFE